MYIVIKANITKKTKSARKDRVLNIVDNEIKRLKEAQDILQSKLETKYATPLDLRMQIIKLVLLGLQKFFLEFHIMFLELLKQEKC